jgi:hypothetical protein
MPQPRKTSHFGDTEVMININKTVGQTTIRNGRNNWERIKQAGDNSKIDIK